MPRLRKQPRDLSGRIALISGGARGIGRETAVALKAAGMRVAIGDLDVGLAKDTADEIGVLGLALDVTSTDSWHSFVSTAAEMGPIDVLVNNAGIMLIGPVLEETQRATFDVNVHGVLNGVKAVAPGMVQRGRGHVVNLASAVGRVPAAGGVTYTASKHAVVGISDALRLELAPYGVDVSMVLPSLVRTELAVGVPDTRSIPTQTPQDVAAVILDVLRRPVAEAWAPRWAQPLARLGGVTPRRAQGLMMRALRGDVVAAADPAARAAYEARVRGGADRT